MLGWIAAIAGAVVILFLIDREIYFYEGVHLNPRVQRWLYDRWAERYDQGKQASQTQDAERLARPLLADLAGVPGPLVLDLAAGTGRFSYALLREPGFHGAILALDISHGMLEKAAAKLKAQDGRVKLVQYLNMPLPFPDDSFDAVACLEALEVMPEMRAPLAEIRRVLRPGGILITSRGTEASGRKLKVCPAEEFSGLLQSVGFEQVEIAPWWKLFDLVRARKPGRLTAHEPRALEDVLRCPACGQPALEPEAGQGLRCRACRAEVKIDSSGIYLYSG